MTAQPTTTMTNDALKYACAKREREIERSSIERERVAADLLQRLMLCRPFLLAAARYISVFSLFKPQVSCF